MHSGGGFGFRVLERESLGRTAYASLAAEAQLIDGTCVKLVVLLEHPLNCLGLRETSVEENERGATQANDRLTVEHKLFGNAEHTVNAHCEEVTLLNHSADTTGGHAKHFY